MTKKVAPRQAVATARIDKHVLDRMRTLAFWQQRKLQEVLQEACNAYLHQQASASFKEHIKKQGQEYGQVMLEQAFEGYSA